MTAERLDQSLLAELYALDQLRTRYQLDNPAAQLGAEDPDVRRMLEAMAYSLVRTRHKTQRNLQATWRRLLSSYFQFLLQPLPAMTLAQAKVTAGVSESVVLPRGSHLKLRTLDGFVGTFTTQNELRVLPANLTGIDLLLRRDGYRLVLYMEAQYRRSEDLGVLRFHIHYLNNYLSALRVQRNLERHLQGAAVVYDSAVRADTVGIPCQASFGSYFEEHYEGDDQNPLERARNFFHFPEADLFINVRVPPAQRAWLRFAVILDLDADFPRDPPLYRENFLPWVVPISNTVRSLSRPIEVDGTQDAYPIRYAMDDYSFVLQRSHGVSRLTPGGLERLYSAALSSLAPSYEVEERSDLGVPGAYALILRMPEAIAKSQQLVVDATWFQPEFASHAIGPIAIRLWDRVVPGLLWESVGGVRSPLECPLRQDADRLLHLLSLKMKPILDCEEIAAVLSMFGTIDAGVYRDLPRRLTDVAVEVVPDGQLQGAGIRHLYHVVMRPPEPEEEALHARFLRQLGALLDAWDFEARAELRVESAAGSLKVLPALSAYRERTR
jgi:type VI secretion system protein ImpG